MNTVRDNKADIVYALEEWSSAKEQSRLWLSDGCDGAEVSSFEEASESLFSDTGLRRELALGNVVFGEPVDTMLVDFGMLCADIDFNRAPSEIIEDKAMKAVRAAATKLLDLLKSDNGE